jgi:ABC-type sugar transport system permease subunit
VILRRATPLLFLAPALALIALFRIVPLVEGVYLSLTDWDGFDPPRWVGLHNYRRLLSDDVFVGSIVHNLLFLAAIPIWVGLPFLVAALIHRGQPGARAFRIAAFLPPVLPGVAVGVLFTSVLGYRGAVNSLLGAAGLGALKHSWLAESSTALLAVIAVVIWATFGIGVVIFSGAMSAVSKDLEDAARIEGSSWWQVQRYVVIPAVRSTLILWTLVVTILSMASLFPFVFVLTNGGPANKTYVLDFYVYEQAFQNGRLGYAAAGGIVLLAIVFVPLLAIAGSLALRRRLRA